MVKMAKTNIIEEEEDIIVMDKLQEMTKIRMKVKLDRAMKKDKAEKAEEVLTEETQEENREVEETEADVREDSEIDSKESPNLMTTAKAYRMACELTLILTGETRL